MEPKARFAPRNEAHMPAMFGCDELQIWIPRECRVLVDLERDERVVFSLDHESRHVDLIQEALCRLRRIIVVRSSETECRSRVDVVEVVNRLNGPEARKIKQPGPQPLLEKDALLQPPQETARIQNVHGPVEALDAGSKIDGRRNCANPRDDFMGPFAQLARQLEDDIAAEREADRIERRCCAFADLARDREKIASLPGMIERVTAQRLRAATTPHVEPMNRITGLKRALSEAHRITGCARSLQSMHDNQEIGRAHV